MDLTKGDLGTLIRKIAVPSSIGFFFNTLFNIIDNFYIGYIGVEALAGLSLSFPVFFILISIGSGIGMGVSALISNLIGERDYEKGFYLAMDSITLSFIVGIIITILGLKYDETFFKFMGAEGSVLLYGVNYTKWIFLGSIFFVINMILNGILVAQGNTKTYRNFLIVGVLINIILDPFFIFVLGMTTDGVAIATVLIQIVGNIYLYLKVKDSMLICKRSYKLKKPNIKNIIGILEQGIPSSFSMMTIALGIFVINFYVNQEGGEKAIAAYGIAMRIEQLVLLPAIGLNSAALSIAGQNFGAKNLERVKDTYFKTLKYGLIIMTSGMVVILPLVPYLYSIFTKDVDVLKYGMGYFRVEIFVFNSYVILNIGEAVLRGLKYPKFSIFVGIYRQFLMPILCFPISIKIFNGITGIWIGILGINWTAAIIMSLYLLYAYKKEKIKKEIV